MVNPAVAPLAAVTVVAVVVPEIIAKIIPCFHKSPGAYTRGPSVTVMCVWSCRCCPCNKY